MAQKRITKAQEELTLLSWFIDLAENGDLKPFLEHIGFDMAAIRESANPEHFFQAFKQHYTRRGRIDENQIGNDLATYPPIAALIIAGQIANADGKKG